MRDAALSLALTHPFAGELANPRQMKAFTYSGSPAILPDDRSAGKSLFTDGPSVGALLPDANYQDGFLSDQLGDGFTVLCFDTKIAQQINQFDAADNYQLSVLLLPWPSQIADKLAANAQTAYLVRPDMYIAGR
ncbi:MAG: hypothetical protein AB8B87_23340 [Granulosicoccus sp.]